MEGPLVEEEDFLGDAGCGGEPVKVDEGVGGVRPGFGACDAGN